MTRMAVKGRGASNGTSRQFMIRIALFEIGVSDLSFQRDSFGLIGVICE
jgi:hypothetical protein